MSKHQVSEHVRQGSGGAVRVRPHLRTSRGRSEIGDVGAAQAAAREASAGAPDAGAGMWEDRHVTLAELSTAMSAVGAGQAPSLAPLMEVSRGPHGTTFVSAVKAVDDEMAPFGAIQVTDPLAVSETEQTATVNSRFLLDAIRAHDAHARKSLNASDISIDGESVSVGGTEVTGSDGWDSVRRSAKAELDEIKARAEEDGITPASAGWGYPDRMREWGDQQGIDYEEIAQRANSPHLSPGKHQRYSGPSQKAEDALAHAQHLLESAGEPSPDLSVTAAEFIDEVSRVIPARTYDTNRPVLNAVSFGSMEDRPVMVSSNSYVACVTKVNVPDSLAEAEAVIDGSALEAWIKPASSHVKGSDVRLGVSEGSCTMRIRTNAPPQWRRHAEQAEYETVETSVTALQAGQMKVAIPRIGPMDENSIRSIQTVFPPEAETAVTVPASEIAGLGKKRRKLGVLDRVPAKLTLAGEGEQATLSWEFFGPGRDDMDNFDNGRRRVRGSGQIKATRTGPGDETVGVNPDFMGTAVLFAGAGDKSALVDLRRWDPVKPMVITQHGAREAHPRHQDRCAIVMPVRVA